MRLVASGSVDEIDNIAHFVVPAKQKTACSTADNGIFRQRQIWSSRLQIGPYSESDMIGISIF
jgi:hypothetical protein